MNFIESIQTCYKKTFNFKDRASKSKFWLHYILVQMMGQKIKIGLDLNQKNKL